MITLLCLCLSLAPQDPTAGVRQYEQGEFAAAAETFRQAVTALPESAPLLYDLALAEWRAGNLSAAEDAIERYAAAPGGGRIDLHRGLLGNIRYTEATKLAESAAAPPSPPTTSPVPGTPATPPVASDPVQQLQQAVDKAKAARDEFVRAASSPRAGAEVLRNTERALRLLADLEKKLEEAKKQQEQQKGDGKDQRNDKNDKSDKNDKNDKQDQQQKSDQSDDKQDQKQQQDQQQKQDQQRQDGKQDEKSDKQQQPDDKQNQQSGDARPEPKQEPQQEPKQPDPKQDPKQEPQDAAPEPKAGDEQKRPEPKGADDKGDKNAAGEPQPRSDAPGEQVQAGVLSPEQKQRLLDQLLQLDERLRKLRAAARTGKKPVERDW